jgi:flagellar basal-body rod protein FlgG
MAIRALNTAASGMKAMQTKVDVLANNLANVSTTGYKRDRADFADLIYQQMRRPGILTPAANRTATGIEIGHGVQTVAVAKEHEQGALQQTGNQYDWAIDGSGYFQIEVEQGLIAYTRDGSFRRDGEGNVVTAQGYKLFPNVVIPENVTDVEITIDGRIMIREERGQNATELTQIELARFPNPRGLESIGDNLYRADPNSTGNIITGVPGDTDLGKIRGRFLEASNVDVVQSMVDLIKAQRSYEFNADAIRSGDQMLQQASALLR